MASYHSASRTNYVEVTDAKAFREVCEDAGLTVIEEGTALGWMDDTGEIGIPSYDFDADEDIDFLGERIAPLLADGQVLVYMEAGAEKLRYISGLAVAINNRGERREVSLYDIYNAAKELGDTMTPAEY